MHPPTPAESACAEALRLEFPPSEADPTDAHFLTDPTVYLRFARARDGDITKATAMLRECLEWRKAYKPHEIAAAQVEDILRLGTVFMAGVCAKQRPVMYMTPGAKNPFSWEKRVQLIVFLLEETTRRGYCQLTWIFDFSKMGQRGKDEHSRKTGKETMHILQYYYPERLGVLFMVNTPWYFRAIATLMWPFIDKRTKEKIYTSMKVKHLPEHVPKHELIEEFGGERKVQLGEQAAELRIEDLLPPSRSHSSTVS